MAKYKCKNLGECDRANSGEVFEIVAGDDLKCPSCGIGSMLEIVKTPTGGSAASKLPLIITGAVVTVMLLAGGGYYFIAGSAGAPIASAPVETVLAPAPAPVEAPAPTPDPMPTPAPEVPQPAQPGIAPTEVETKALRQESEKNLTTGDVASAEQASNKAAANEIIKLAIAKMAQGKLAEAESELMAARERDPKQTLVSYNMAVLRLKQGRKDEALKELEASFRDGFSYFDQMDKDTDLDGIRKDARFNELVALYRDKSSIK